MKRSRPRPWRGGGLCKRWKWKNKAPGVPTFRRRLIAAVTWAENGYDFPCGAFSHWALRSVRLPAVCVVQARHWVLQRSIEKWKRKSLTIQYGDAIITKLSENARVVELADSLDSGSSVHSGRAGSSPASRTIQNPVVSTATGFFAAVSALFSALCWIIFLNAS